MEPPLIIGLVLAAGLSVGSLFGSYRSQKRRRLLEALPTSATQGVFIGLVELKGTAESSSPLTTYLAEVAAVHFRWSVSEQWERWETETYTDSNGKRRTRRVRKSGWTTVASGGESQPFYLRDETGVLLVRPDGAEVRGITVFNQYCGRGNPLYYGKGPASGIMNSTGKRHFSESAIVLHEELYIVGQARERSDIVAAEVAAQEAAPLFLVTAESEAEVRRRLGASAILWWLAGTAAAAGAGAILAQGPGAIVGGLGYALLAGGSRMMLIYNSMIDTRNRMRQGFSQIDIQLRRRADLIPPLVEVVEGIAEHEQAIQEALAEMRAESKVTGPGEPGDDPHALAPKLRVVAESYPVLKSDTHFLRLQEQLVETEQRLALARSYFNEIASEWNNRVEQFPDSILARLFRFHHQPLFEATDFERAPIEIDLAE